MASTTVKPLALQQEPNQWKPLAHLISASEDWLMRQILHSAKVRDYAKYTSTLKEAWRLSISGLSNSLLAALRIGDDLELGPDDDYTLDPVASFGIVEAQRHRKRGVDLRMFLGLMKYYRQSYLDVLNQAGFDNEYKKLCALMLERFFDRVEIGFCAEWASSAETERLHELQISNRIITNEKNKYLTIYESQPNPVILLDKQNRIDNLNHSAAMFFQKSSIPGAQYYCNLKDRFMEGLDRTNTEEATCFSGAEAKKLLPWITKELNAFVDGDEQIVHFEKHFPSEGGARCFGVKLSQMLDISGKFSGTVVNLEDLTVQRKADRDLKESEEKYRNLVDNSLVGVFKTNLDGHLLYANESLARILQFDSVEAATSESVAVRYKTPEDREVLIERLMKAGKVSDFEVELATDKGNTISVIMTAVLAGDTISGMIMDISQRKRTENELKLANQKILKQQKGVIEDERLKVLLQMAGATAHELNQPLTVLLGNVELMQADLEDKGKAAQYLSHIESSGVKISEIVKKIENIRHYQTKPYLGRCSIINFDQEVYILSVDNSLGDYETLKDALKSYGQIKLSWAKDMNQALQAIESRPIDVVFVNHILPDGNSQDLLALLKAKGIEKPVIVITGQDDETTASQAVQAGAYDYLPKNIITPESLFRSISNALEKFRLKTEIKSAQKKMAEMSTRDELTGLSNRPYFIKSLERGLNKAEKENTTLALCVLNLDRFRRINDTFGHAAGDEVLTYVGNKLTEAFGKNSVLCRYRGEEFAVILPETDQRQAGFLCEQFRARLAEQDFEYNNALFPVTVSVGIAFSDSLTNTSHVELLKIANHALSEAKDRGRNTVVEYVRRKQGEEPRLGQVMVFEGYITDNELQSALSEQRLKLGEMLVRAGRLTAQQLTHALGYQKKISNQLGEILKKLGHTTEKDIAWALGKMKRKLGEIVRDSGLITDIELHRLLVLQRYESRWLR